MQIKEKDRKQLCLTKERLKTFKMWPHKVPTAQKMAEAGYYHCPNQQEKDLARCYLCQKELDCWEPDDDPWMTHSADCEFAKLKKLESGMTVEEFLTLQARGLIRKCKPIIERNKDDFKTEAEKIKKNIIQEAKL